MSNMFEIVSYHVIPYFKHGSHIWYAVRQNLKFCPTNSHWNIGQLLPSVKSYNLSFSENNILCEYASAHPGITQASLAFRCF